MPRSRSRPVVAVAAKEPDTLTSITSYLDAAGIATVAFTDLADVSLAPSDAAVFILFPDAFRWEVVVSALVSIREGHRSALPVIVTSTPRRYEELTLGERVLVVPRPVWGWSVLDGIRFHIAHTRRALDAKVAPAGLL